ncbi:unnamed protein product [Effrenium voratum]|nr:unnamed protein product [Effrenium voratum]
MALAARVARVSKGGLALKSVPGLGRCLEVAEPVECGVLAEEAPLALGSSLGRALARTADGSLEASEDLLAACLELELEAPNDEAKSEALQVAAELELGSDAQTDGELLSALRPEMRRALGERAPEMLRLWRRRCDVNAETWAELQGSEVVFLYGLFGALAMVEHSCRPNCRVEWDAERRLLRLVALRALDRGQRVTRSYLDMGLLLSPRNVRQQSLQQGWGFHCCCPRCATPGADASSDVDDADELAAAAFFEVLDLQRCVEGLPLGTSAAWAVASAEAAARRLGLPELGTLRVLRQAMRQGVDMLRLAVDACEEEEGLPEAEADVAKRRRCQ